MRVTVGVMVSGIALAALFVSACSGGGTTTTTIAGTPASTAGPTTTAATTTLPVVTVDARFSLGTVVFGEQGGVEVINTGSQAANVHGFWIAVHPFYLELPSAIVEVGEAVTIAFDPEASPDAFLQAAGLLPLLEASNGEVGLYASGNFGDPDAIRDYVEWGVGGHFRSTVAEAAGIWDPGRIVTTSGDEGGLQPIVGQPPELLDADLVPLPAEA